MIRVHKQNNELCVFGHADYDVRGRDIVCAGVSTLIYTLAESLEVLTDAEIEYMDDGKAVAIKWNALTKEVKLLVDAFFIGIKALQDEFPDYVSII